VIASKKNKTASKMPVKSTKAKAEKGGKPPAKAITQPQGKASSAVKKTVAKTKTVSAGVDKKVPKAEKSPKKVGIAVPSKLSKSPIKSPSEKTNTPLKPSKQTSTKQTSPKTPQSNSPAQKSLEKSVKPLPKSLPKAATKIVASKTGAKTAAIKPPTLKAEKPKPAPTASKAQPEKKPTLPKANLVAKTEEKSVKPTAIKHDPVPPPSNTNPAIVAKIRSAQAEKELRKDLAQPAPKTSLTPLNPIPQIIKGKDRLILMVRDPYWIHAHWDIMRHSVDRAKAALAENWHTVKPILRLLKLDDSGTTNNSEVIYRDIEIHGGVRNWYIDVDSPPSRFKLLMGYLCANSRFYELARSNIVTTPAPGGKEATDDHWADIATDAEHIYSMSGGYGDDTQTGDLTDVFEERLKRTMDADVLSQFGSGAEGSLKRHKQFHFDVNAELVVFGSTHPEAHVSVGTEPVKVRSDGSFSIRLPLPDRRQVLPATAKSRDGVDEQTVVIAVERNTKIMEPLSSDTEDL
jgi:hypothetical protein